MGPLEERHIVCVGFADWQTELWTNQQHLMSRLARKNRVLFVESLGLRRPMVASRDVRRIAGRLRRGLGGPRRLDGVHVLSPLVLPFHASPLARRLNARLLRLLVRRAMRRLGMEGDVLWAYVPQAELLIGTLEPRTVLYHCVDDIAAQERIDTDSFRDAEVRFAGRADLVLASSQPLVARMRGLSNRVLYAPNVADHELFSAALGPGPVDPALAALPRPRIVFTGSIVEAKLDFELITALARTRPSWSIALVGPVGLGDPRTDVSPLREAPNVHLLGGRAYDRLPDVLRGADAAIIPYAINELTTSVFPMKVYEYMAAGLPVLATPLPSLAGVHGVVTARTAVESAGALDELMAADGPAARGERSAAASRFSWEERLVEIAEALKRAGA